MKTDGSDRVDAMKLAQSGQTLKGECEGARLARWAASAPAPDLAGPVGWTAAFELQTDASGHAVAWMDLDAHAETQLVCQRCLTPMNWTQSVHRRFRFVATETEALAEDNDSEEDVLALDQELDLRVLVEDELIMDLPLVPMHEQCPNPVHLSAQTPDFVEKPPAFSALAQLKIDKKD